MKAANKKLLLSALAGSVSALSLSVSSAMAQDNDDQDEIIVTGSRIATDSTLTSASPIETVSADNIATSGQIDVTELLRESPALQGSLPGSFSTVQGADTEDSDTGIGLLNLRSLGIERTLVLQNGKRHVPGTSGQAAVDINTIPVSLIERVDVFTGGAAAIYGADAVTGVVNFLLRDGRDFDGLEFRAQTGISDNGDAEEAFVSVAGGGEFADGRGSAVFSVEYTLNTPVLAQDRSFAGAGFSDLTDSNAALAAFLGTDPNAEQAFAPNVTLPISSALGIIAIDDAANFPSAFGAVVGLDGSTPIPTLPGTNIPVAQVFDNGVLRPFDPGIFVNGFAAVGGDGITAGNAPAEIILPEQDRILFNAAGDYQLNDFVTFYAEGKFAFTDTTDQDGIPFNDDIPILLDNPFIPTALQDQISTLQGLGIDPAIAVSRDILDADVFPVEEVDRTTIRLVGGVKGEIPETGLDYEVSVAWGRTDITSTGVNTRLDDRFFAGIDSVSLTGDNIDLFSGTAIALRNGENLTIDENTAQVGDIICRSELDGSPPGVSPFPQPPVFPGPPDSDPTILNGQDVSGLGQALSFQFGDDQCAPINILGTNTITGAGADFAFVNLVDTSAITQLQILATIAGDSSRLFELPAGPVGFALGVEYREDTSLFTPNPFASSPAITSGAVSGGPTFQSPILTDDFPDQINVIEGFLEAKVPVLRDLPFAQLLEINGAARFSNYNTIGNTTVWSVGGRWQPYNDLTLRGTYAVTVRAPNIGELFGPTSPSLIGLTADPCDATNINAGSSFRPGNCAQFVDGGFEASNFLSAFVPGTSGGNPNLLEETSTTFTAGFVYRPTNFLSGLVVTADYYNIDIQDAIDSLTGAQIAAACVDLPSTDNNFCDNVTRDATDGFLTGFTAGQINLGSLETSGVDYRVAYNYEIPGGDYGTLDLSATGTRFLSFVSNFDPTSDVTIGEIADPLEQLQAQVSQDITEDQLGELGLPRWITNFNADWNKGAVTVSWNGRLESSQLAPGIDNIEVVDVVVDGGSVVVNPDTTFVAISQQETGIGFVHDFNVNYEFSENLSIYGGVNNAFDRDPFIGTLVRPAGPRGRFFFIGVRGAL